MPTLTNEQFALLAGVVILAIMILLPLAPTYFIGQAVGNARLTPVKRARSWLIGAALTLLVIAAAVGVFGIFAWDTVSGVVMALAGAALLLMLGAVFAHRLFGLRSPR